ncbi:response regulator [Psychrosphaera ytuae]|uniref:Response regulator n=1 Tax=Psychrosphaera ytuae TaxID=2820710 RepID=A0A975HIN4_9GAMM|nr:response regulator [Psychrosphaera ytuae]QTH64348.1 response regulator [Psychrosphaera ytuae]
MNKRLLVIDDAEDILHLFYTLLTDLGFRDIDLVSTGREAISALRSHRYDLVILDIELPDINGKQVLDTINVEGFDAPVVMCSAHNSVDNVQVTWEMGAKGFLSKPVDPNKLKNLLERIGVYS